jgi:CubicO group peptidase (beta-lactamase class C family)
MKARTRSLRIVVLVLWATSAFAQQQLPATRISAVENGLTPVVVPKGRTTAKWNLAERMKTYHVPGVSVAVVRGYRLDWAKGYGVRDHGSGEAVTTETLFQAASISKPVAATAAMKLVEQRKLTLDRDVNLDLRSWKVPENEFTAKEKVTLRRILSHSAGLTVHGFPGYEASGGVPQLLDVLNGKNPANTPPIRVETAPGWVWNYSGGGYTVMQQLVIDITGESFPDGAAGA